MVRLGGSGAGTFRLVLARKLPGAEFEVSPEPESEVTFLDSQQLQLLGANPIQSLGAGSFFLGAASSPEQRAHGEWEYRARWVFFDAPRAFERMEAVYQGERLDNGLSAFQQGHELP